MINDLEPPIIREEWIWSKNATMDQVWNQFKGVLIDLNTWLEDVKGSKKL